MLKELEFNLSGLSHSEDGLQVVQKFCDSLQSTAERMRAFNVANAIVRPPIEPGHAASLGFDTPDDRFILLQGDIIRTEAAFFMGQRISGRAKFAVLNSSCDLVPDRRKYASLLPILQIRKDEPGAKAKLSRLLKFTPRDSMYLPPLPDDDSDVVGNLIQFDGLYQIEGTHLALATRVASLSLVGWRIFACFSRVVFARANPREIEIRAAVENPVAPPAQPMGDSGADGAFRS